MLVIITHYVKKANGRDTEYVDGKPVTKETKLELPIKFGYGSYNEPKKLQDRGIDVDDVISIEEAELPRIVTPTSKMIRKAFGDLMGVNGDRFIEEINKTGKLSQRSYEFICDNVQYNSADSVIRHMGLVFYYVTIKS
jgi:hypothetical protein